MLRFEEIFSYALSGNDFVWEGVDTDTNEHLKETLGVSSTPKVSSLFLSRSLNLKRWFQKKFLRKC